MDLNETNVSASLVRIGSDVIEVSAGKHLKIKTSPSGEEFLDVIVPVGKVWQVSIHVKIVETDV